MSLSALEDTAPDLPLEEPVKQQKLVTIEKMFIMRCLAEFMTHGETLEAFFDKFGKEIPRWKIRFYDPQCQSDGGVGKKLLDYYRERRKIAQDDIELIPIANPRAQLIKLQRIVDRHAERAATNTASAKIVLDAIKLVADLRGQLKQKVEHDVTHHVEVRNAADIQSADRLGFLQGLHAAGPSRRLAAPVREVDYGFKEESASEAVVVGSHREDARDRRRAVVVGDGDSGTGDPDG